MISCDEGPRVRTESIRFEIQRIGGVEAVTMGREQEYRLRAIPCSL
jgi:hypothetical protein